MRLVGVLFLVQLLAATTARAFASPICSGPPAPNMLAPMMTVRSVRPPKAVAAVLTSAALSVISEA